MSVQKLPVGFEATLHSELRSLPKLAFEAWRRITLQQWTWTTAIALLLLVANALGVLPAMVRAVPYPIGQQHTGVDVVGPVGAVAIYLETAYCFLLAVSVAELDVWPRKSAVRRY